MRPTTTTGMLDHPRTYTPSYRIATIRTIAALLVWLVTFIRPIEPALYAQDSAALDLRQTADLYDTRGFQGQPIYVDGRLLVGESSGSVSYTYPISSYTKKGYPISVSLNYCGAVNCTAFGDYTTSSVQGFGAYRQRWNRFDQSRPVWILSLNGWGIQCLSQATAFHAPPNVISSDFTASTSTHTSFNDRTAPWVIDGYDYCNRMRNLATGVDGQYPRPYDYRDVIRLLRGDGSVLELYNNTSPTASDWLLADRYFTGYYHPTGANDKTFAIVELDTASRPGFLTSAGVSLANWSNVHQIQPRIAHVFTGDGLCYTFREMVIPYGTADYNAAAAVPNFGGMVAGPTIFYLAEISSNAGPIMTVRRSRQTDGRYLAPVLDTYDAAADSTRGRALTTEFDDHTITYDRDQLTIQALGRTTLVRFWDVLADGNAQDSIGIPFQRLGYPGRLSQDEAALGLTDAQHYKSWLGYVNEIIDPEGRTTTFDYEQVLRRYQNCGFPYLGTSSAVNFYARNLRLKHVTEPTANYEINYKARGTNQTTSYGPNDWIPILGSSYGNDQTKDPWLLRDMVDSVVKSDCSGPLLVEAYAYQGIGSTVSMVQHTTKDLLAGTVHTRKYWYAFDSLPRIVSDLPRARFTKVVKTHDTADASATSPAVGVLTVTAYDSLAPFIWQPRTITASVNGIPKTRTRYEYTLRDKPTAETDSAALALFGQEIGERTEYQGCACDTAMFNTYRMGWSSTTKYMSLPEFHVSFSGAGRYNERASFKNYEDYYAAHPTAHRPAFEAVKFDPAFAVWDSNDSAGFYLPPVYSLDTSTVTLSGTSSTERRTWYTTGNFADGTHVPRGWILRDTTYGKIGNGPTVIGGGSLRSYTYDAAFAQWRPLAVTNGVGARSEGIFDGDSLAAGVLDDHDSARIDRHGPPNALAWTFEQPTLERSFVRRTTSGGSTRTDTITTRHDFTFYGLPAETIDANGWSTRGEFDRDGRLRMLRLPLDYNKQGNPDSIHVAGTRAVALYGSSVDTVTYDTNICHWTESRLQYNQLYGYHVTTQPERFSGDFQVDRPTLRKPPCDDCNGTGRTQRKGGDGSSLLTTCNEIPYQYRSPRWAYIGCKIRPEDATSIASLDSARLVLLVTQNETRCANVIVEIPQFNFRRTYVFGCLDAPVQTSHNQARAHSTGTPAGSVATLPDACDEALTEVYHPDGYLFRVDLGSIKDSLIAAGNRGASMTVRLSTSTPGASMTFSSDYYADYRPALELVGTFAQTADQNDYTLAYENDDAHLTTTVRAKVDDSRHSASHSGAGSSFTIRQYERVNRFGADFRLRKSFTTIGDPLSPDRIDSVVNQHDGFGSITRVSDQNGDTTATQYDGLGRPIRITNADGTRATIAYRYGHWSTFGLPIDTQHVTLSVYDYGRELFRDTTLSYVCDFAWAKITTNENGTKSAAYFDGLDRLRRQVVDSGAAGHLHLTTTFDYDQLGRLTRTVNPKGDTTRYVYDELGRVLYASQSDLGTVSYAYDRLGNVRFSQSQEQADSNRVTFAEYDDLNRMTLIGEATIDPPGGSGFGSRIVPKGGKGDRAGLMSGASTLHRLTDTLDGNRLYLSSAYAGAITVNTSLHLGSSGPVAPTLPALTLYDSVYCALMPNAMLGETEPPTGPFLRHPVQYYTPVTTPHGSMGNFEHLKFNPHFARTAVAYDTFPPIAGTIWGTLPAQTVWNALTPTGKIRNLKGHEAAIAYREHGGEPYHYVVMSYDERGRVEALLRYTENLGFDAVYYAYNSANQVTTVRVADPLRQYQSWYGYDWNARVDSVWSLLGPLWGGLGVRSPHYPAPLTQPTAPDIVYDYTKVGQLAAMRFPPVNVLVSYAYDHRKQLDSLVAMKGASPLFKEVLGYDPVGQIVSQRFTHGTAAEQAEIYRYDSAQRLTRWVHGTDSVSWGYDPAGNRTDQLRRVPLAGLRTDVATYSGTNGPNHLAAVITQDSTGAVTGLQQYGYNANGSTTSKTALTGLGGTVLKEEHYGYGFRELTNQYIDGAPTSSQRLDWRYRYNEQGAREQKRLYYGPDGDENEHVYPWVYYQLGGSQEQLAVYHGQQMLGPCAPTRAVLLYPVEYITTGLGYTGVREAISPLITTPTGGKRFRISDHLASLRVEIGPAGTGQYDYDPWGELTQFTGIGASRLAYNDHERDPESGDLSLGRRQDDAAWGRFNSVDVLWSQHPEESPYAYASNNPLRYTDPTGMQSSVLQVPFDEGGEGVPTGGVSMYEVYIANHPEIASKIAYEEKWGAGKAEVAGKAEETGSKSEGAERAEKAEQAGKSETGTLQAGESVQTAEATAKASAKAQNQMERNSGQQTKQAGTDFTRANKRIVWERNAEKYNGTNKCENCETEVQKPEQHKKGVTPPANEGHVDHVIPKSTGGKGTPDNGQILCRDCNLEKGNKP